MAVKFEKVQPGMVLFHRFRRSVGNVRGMKSLEETRLTVRGVDAERRVVQADGPRGGVLIPASRLGSYFTWSMRDSEVAEVERSAAGHVTRVVRKKGTKKATPGREWYTTPDKGVGVTVDPASARPLGTGPTTSPARRPRRSVSFDEAMEPIRRELAQRELQRVRPRRSAPVGKALMDPAEVMRRIRAQVADNKALGPDYVDALATTLERVARSVEPGRRVRRELEAALDAMAKEGLFARAGVADPREG